ncbi:hypothetical protein KW794_02720 [Candidatus Saccharibacteria bacterium]|nr:hypothetical protein [Candidatus Saccharibacteria bacterium]
MKTSHKVIGGKVGYIQEGLDILVQAQADMTDRSLIKKEAVYRHRLLGLPFEQCVEIVNVVLAEKVRVAKLVVWQRRNLAENGPYTPDDSTHIEP